VKIERIDGNVKVTAMLVDIENHFMNDVKIISKDDNFDILHLVCIGSGLFFGIDPHDTCYWYVPNARHFKLKIEMCGHEKYKIVSMDRLTYGKTRYKENDNMKTICDRICARVRWLAAEIEGMVKEVRSETMTDFSVNMNPFEVR
jgi:hypothetical protein